MRIKKIEEYNKKYGDIPKNTLDRFNYLLRLLHIRVSDIEKLKNEIKIIKKIKYKTLTFIFYFVPQATPRPRCSKFTKVFYVKNIIDYNKIFGEFIEECGNIDFKITTPCRFITKTYSPTPNSMNKQEKILSELEMIKNISKPDWDNLGKTYSDMIQKHLIIDDSLIFDGRVQKFYSIKPRIEITIDYATDYDCKFNKNKIENWTSFNNE